MKRSVLVVALAILVAAGAGAAVYSEYGGGRGGTGSLSTSSEASSTPTSCTTTFPDGLALRSSGNETRLFTLLPGGTGIVCVTYSVDMAAMTQASETVQFGAMVDRVQASYGPNLDGEGYVYSYTYHPVTGVEESAAPSEVTFLRGSGNDTTVTVAYTIAAGQNTSGYYSLSFTSCSPLIPFAITDDWQGVGVSDFPGFFVPAGCTDQPPLTDPIVTGLAAINTTLLAGQHE
jgi:hypothetical protein